MSESLIRVPGYKIPGYRIEREIGRGGMATVYLALQESLNRHVALKVMNPVLTTDDDFKTRFLNEGHIVGQLSHSNIVTVFDIGVHDDHYYLSMELLRGGSLRDKIRQGLPLGMALKVAQALGNALGYAHSRGFIHRDIKPPNVLFREDGSAVLTDFGIAKALGSNSQLTRTGYAFGSVGYMSPEQSLGKPIDHRADLYSFGVMFWEMLTGERLYEATDAFALALKHATAPIPSLPTELQAFQPVIQKLLAKEPEERFEKAEEFVAAIDRLQLELSLTDAALTNPQQPAVSERPNAEAPARRASEPQDATLLATAANQSPTPKPSSGGGMKYALLVLVLVALGAGGYVMLQAPLPGPETAEPDTTEVPQTPPLATTNNTPEPTVSTTDPQQIPEQPTTEQPTTEQQIAALLEQGRAHMTAGRYNTPADDNAFKAFSAVQALDADNEEARQALLELGRMAQVEKIIQRASELFRQGAAQDSLDAIAIGLRLQADNAALQALEAEVRASLQPEVQDLSPEQLLAQAQTQKDLGKLFEPPGDNAFESYQQVLRLEPSNDSARQALIELGRMRQVQTLVQRARTLLEQGNPQESLALIEAGLKLAPDHPDLVQLRDQIGAY